MGLASALSTALTGLTAAEATIDVVGNNLANSNTVGFKSSTASFATQFLQTQSLGSAPTGDSGGTNPRQIGLGTMIANITPDFSQGTIEISSNQMDMAIQGDGFFMVEGQGGNRYFTRNGIFKLNAEDQLTTITGSRLLGYGVDDQFELQTSVLEPLAIPLGSRQVSKATENVYLEGALSPQGDVATTAEIIQTGVLGNALYGQPDVSGVALATAPVPDETTTTLTANTAGHGNMGPGVYQYRFTFYDPVTDSETLASNTISVTLAGADDEIQLGGVLPTDGSGRYSDMRIYRTEADGSYFYRISSGPMPVAPFTDSATDASIVNPNNLLNTFQFSNQYSYYMTFVDDAGVESRPSALIGPVNIAGAIQLRDLPTADAGPNPTDHPGNGWTQRRIYRCLGDDNSRWYRVATISDATTAGLTYTDHADDNVIELNPEIDMDGPRVLSGTELINVIRWDGSVYTSVFEEGTLTFTGEKGDSMLQTQEMTITSTTTMLDLATFMEQALGIRRIPGPDLNNPIPPDISGNPGGSINGNGQIVLVGTRLRLLGNPPSRTPDHGDGRTNEREHDLSMVRRFGRQRPHLRRRDRGGHGPDPIRRKRQLHLRHRRYRLDRSGQHPLRLSAGVRLELRADFRTVDPRRR
jgi:flagellar hook protein FlgE